MELTLSKVKSNLAVLMAQAPNGPLKQIDVVKATNIRPSTVSDIVHSRMKRFDVEHMEKLCDFFDCEPGDLLKRVDD